MVQQVVHLMVKATQLVQQVAHLVVQQVAYLAVQQVAYLVVQQVAHLVVQATKLVQQVVVSVQLAHLVAVYHAVQVRKVPVQVHAVVIGPTREVV